MAKGLPEGGRESGLLGHKARTDWVSHRVMEAESKVCCLEDGRMMTELVTWRDYEVSPPWGSPVWDTRSCGVCRLSRWCCPGCRAT